MQKRCHSPSEQAFIYYYCVSNIEVRSMTYDYETRICKPRIVDFESGHITITTIGFDITSAVAVDDGIVTFHEEWRAGGRTNEYWHFWSR